MNVKIPPEFDHLLSSFVGAAKECFDDLLTGVYLHGSMAYGCFRKEISDIDLLVLVEEAPDDDQKLAFMKRIIKLNQLAPAKGIEMSVLLRKDCNPFLYPTPFVLHFSPAHLEWFKRDPQNYVQNMQGTDRDLAAHAMVTRHYGIVLYGLSIDEAFGEVAWEDYLDSALYDVEEAPETISAEPVSTILNLCRTLALVKDGLCMSKEGGAWWALSGAITDPEHTELIQNALQCYKKGDKMPDPGITGMHFVESILKRIHTENKK